MKFDFKVEGLKELEKNLMELSDEFGPKSGAQAMRPAVKAAMKVAQPVVEQKTPVDEGTLLESVSTKIGKPTKKMLASEHFNRDTIIVGRTGWFWSKPSLWRQSLAVEFGTRKDRAQSPLRNSFDQVHEQMLTEFKQTLGPAIEKKAKALHKKRAKGK